MYSKVMSYNAPVQLQQTHTWKECVRNISAEAITSFGTTPNTIFPFSNTYLHIPSNFSKQRIDLVIC